ncbi:MAG: ABC transporter permease [Anaerolineales bacterium]
MTHNRNTMWWLASLPLLVFLSLPLLAIFSRTSLADILHNLTELSVQQAIFISLSTSLTATLLAVLLGTPLAYLLARGRFRWQRAVDSLVDLPSVIPPSVAGLALLMAFGRRGLVGQFLAEAGLTIAFTPLAVVLAQLFVSAPLYIKSAAIGFGAVETEVEQAAALDGANRWAVFRFVSVPLSWPAIFSGIVIAWARALGEFGATIIFAGNFTGRTQTMPLAIYLGLESDPSFALTLSILLIAFSFLALLIVKGVLHREWR